MRLVKLAIAAWFVEMGLQMMPIGYPGRRELAAAHRAVVRHVAAECGGL